jgi:DNA polymerase-3 subunit epsilon
MREIVFDTETTGLSPREGHRIVEIGCIELLHRVPTGNSFHRYFNPERSMPQEAFAVHGLSEAFLADKPVFATVVDELIDFLGDAPLIAHNAGFDMNFLNAEFVAAGRPTIDPARVIDTLTIARRKSPGARNDLDSLCQRFGIDNTKRTKHGALIDAEILAAVYGELVGGKQAALDLSADAAGRAGRRRAVGARPESLPPRLTDAEISAHRAFIGEMGEKAVWRDYFIPAEPAGAPAVKP